MKARANPVEVDYFVIAKVELSEPTAQDPAALVCAKLTLNDGSIVKATHEMMSRMTPKVGDYWVIQSDGYIYLNPKDVFERKYSPIPEGNKE